MTRPNRKRSDSPSKIATAWKACGGIVTKAAAGVAFGFASVKVCQASWLQVADKVMQYHKPVSTHDGGAALAGWVLGMACVGLLCAAGSELRARATAPKHPMQYKKYYQNPTLRR